MMIMGSNTLNSYKIISLCYSKKKKGEGVRTHTQEKVTL